MREQGTTVHFVSSLPAAEGTCAIYAAGTQPPAGWKLVDTRARCHRKQEEWRLDLASWHAQLMAMAGQATIWSWLMPGSRIHVWQPQIRPLLFALGLYDFLQENSVAEIWAVGCPPEVGEYLEEFSSGTILIVSEHQRRGDLLNRAWMTPGPLLEAASVFKRMSLRVRARALSANPDVIVCSIGLSEGNVRERGDHYFGRVLDDGSLNVHWQYLLTGSSGRRGIEEAVRQTGRSVTWVHQSVSWRAIPSLLWTTYRVRRRLKGLIDRVPLLRISGVSSRAFARRFFGQLFIKAAFLNELLVYRSMSDLLQQTRPAAVCYPYEEKGLEHAIALAAMAAPGIRTIGFAHAAYTSGHLYLQATPPNAAPSPRPQIIAAAGQGLGDWLKREFSRHEPVTAVGSPRWSPLPLPATAHVPASPLRVLVLTSFAHELEVLADWIEERPNLFDGMKVTIRPNSHAWSRDQAAALARLSGRSGLTVDGSGSLESQISASDLVLFCATSAVAEAICQGRIAIYVDWHDLWVTDPTKGEGRDSLARCASADALRIALLAVSRLDRASYARQVERQQQVAARIYGPFNLARFRELVQGSIPA